MDNHVSMPEEDPADAGPPAEGPAPRTRRPLPHHRRHWRAAASRIKVEPVSGFDGMMQVVAIRAVVYMGEMGTDYGKGFDGNDFAATHLLATVDGEPAGCIRIRYFGDFATPERMAVLPRFRTQRFGARGVAHALGQAAFEHCARKGYRTVIGHAKADLVRFWSSFGVFVPANKEGARWGDHEIVPMIGQVEPPDDAVRLDSDVATILAREGNWDHA
ncbi:MAG TPA: GNAT family N-acetyltransferase [Alphaproteobacteria bacterium]|nr:GNAT family N-acetyltransferase [Alphaproteobacteria bacterium]